MMFAASTSGMRNRHDDRGAVDPILVIASIAVTLILLVAGAFNLGAISQMNADDAAKNDLRMLAAAEKAYYAQQLAYTFYDSTTNASTLAPQGMQPNTRIAAAACGDGWVAAAASTSGAVITMTNKAATFGDQTGNGLTLPSCAPTTLVTSVVANATGATAQAPCPTQQTPLGGLTVTQTTSGATTTMKGSLPYETTDYSLKNRWGNTTLTSIRIWVDGVVYCGLATGTQNVIGSESTPPGPSNYTLTINASKLQALNPTAYSRFLTNGTLSFRASGLTTSTPDSVAHL